MNLPFHAGSLWTGAPGHGASHRRRLAAPVRLGRAAFSLIEIMVAVSILAFMIVGLLAMFYHVQRAFRSGVTQSDIMEGGRALMTAMTRELQEAAACGISYQTNLLVVPSPNTLDWGESATQVLPSGSARTNYLQDIAFLTEVNGEWKGIAYRINNRDGVGTLERLEMNLPYESNPFLSTNNLRQFTTDFFSSTLLNNTNYRPVLDGIVHLFYTPYDTNGILHSSAWLPRRPFGYGFTNHTSEALYSIPFTNVVLPAYLEIELGVLEPSAVEKFRASDGSAGFLQRQIGRTHLFRQRIPIRPAASRVADEE